MTTKAVSLNMGVGAAKQKAQQSADSGFSEALGNVDSSRKQPGCQNTDMSQRRQEAPRQDREFGYTERASKQQSAGSQPQSVSDKPVRDQAVSGEANPFGEGYAYDSTAADETAQAAYEVIAEAVESVKQELGAMEAQGIELPDTDDLAAMIINALEKLRKDDEENKDVDEAIKAMTAAIAAIAEDGSVRAFIVDGGEGEDAQTGITATVSVRTVSERFRVFSEKSEEIAMLGGAQLLDETHSPKTVIVSGSGEEELPEESGEELPAAEKTVTEPIKPVFADIKPASEETSVQTAAAQPHETDRTDAYIPENNTEEAQKTSQRTVIRLDTAVGSEETKPADETNVLQNVQTAQGADTAVNSGENANRLLAELLRQAKKELGLTEVSVRTLDNAAEDMPEKVFTGEEHIRVSLEMNKSDRSTELDYILSGGREETGRSAQTQTQTYDAVHMAQQLVGDRTDASIKPEIVMPETNASDTRPPEVQTVQQIIERMDSLRERQQTEFTMVLNPESLGRITVKLVTAGEKVAVQITAENPDTGRLLAERTESMQSMLRENGVDLERYQVVSEGEDAQELMQQSYDGSSKNPYSRQDQQQQDDENTEDFYDILNKL